jgi:tetratricopeptide (TPR) repeat protein
MNALVRRSAIALTLTAAGLVGVEAQAPSSTRAQPASTAGQRAVAAAVQPPSPAEEEAALRIATVYEDLGEFAKSEEQYVIVARASEPRLRDAGLQGLRRVRERLRRDADNTALATGQEYERLGRWEQARDEYAAAIKAMTEPGRKAAIDGFRKADQALFWERSKTSGDSLLLWLGKGVAALLFVLWLPTVIAWIKTSRASVKVFPFIAANDEAGNEILFWLAYARSTLRARPKPPPGAVLMVAASSLPYIELPHLPAQVTEIANLEFGAAKIGLKDALQVIALPKTRISGGWTHGAAGSAYAELERRHWLEYRFHSRVLRTIHDGNRASDLELFGYDVLIKAIEAHGR